MSDHYSVEFNEDGPLNEENVCWWPGRCNCGADLGVFPSAKDACDALMAHAYAAGAGAENSQEDPA